MMLSRHGGARQGRPGASRLCALALTLAASRSDGGRVRLAHVASRTGQCYHSSGSSSDHSSGHRSGQSSGAVAAGSSSGPTPGPGASQEAQPGRWSGRSGAEDGPASLAARMGEAAATTLASVLVLGLGFGVAGYGYHKFYKYMQLHKIEGAFRPGDPVLELAALGKEVPARAEDDNWIVRAEQGRIDGIINGTDRAGHYFLVMGEKGTGKSSMLLEALRKIDGDGCAMLEAHADLEIFRLRLGKALDYEFHEDYIGGYFSERGPRDTTALLDIERALNKLEKVALKHRARKRRPLIIVINQTHLIRDNDDGKDLLELLQQKAEQWAASGLVSMVFNSDDYWVYERFKQLATRLEVISIHDLPKAQAISALRNYRERYFGEKTADSLLEQVYFLVGGRLNFLNRVAKSKDMLATCREIKTIEKTWFLNQCWILGPEMDDDVMDQQKWAAGAMVLALALVDREEEMDKTWDEETGHVLPTFAMHEAQQIMTRSDFIRDLDRLNLVTITSSAQVRASSVPMHRAFQEICSAPGFRRHLEATIQRIADIESLGRTRELVAKDLVLGGRYELSRPSSGGARLVLEQAKGESAN